MTTYSAIANSEIAVGAPITNSLMTKVRDNPLAIQEDDASAPTIAYATEAGTITSQGTLATLNSVSEAVIDWPNTEGMTQFQLSTGEENSTTSTSWTTIRTVKAYIPGGANFFECWAELKVGTSTILGYVRLKVGAATATGVSNDITSYAWLGADSVAISASSGWVDVEIQAYTDNVTSAVTIRNVTVRIK